MLTNHNNDDRTETHIILTKGTQVRHYRIIEKIGTGGMGEVYLAEDTRLKRHVALKFLPQHLCQDEDCRARFKREAQAVAQLNHPNIVTIHEVDEHNGCPFIVMEHVKGRSLRELIEQGNVILDKVIDGTIQICEGLQAAHSAGIIHRDIKPANIIIDISGRPRILDFGLATVSGSDKLTRTGSTLGTVGYMSPEQIEGGEIDYRTDLFSLGIVLYELFAGRSPFKRETEAATLNCILNDTPEPLARYKSNISDDLQRTISKLLEKDPNLRYQSAAGLISDLRRIEQRYETPRTKMQPAAAAQQPSIAVLPFKDLSPQGDQEYFCDGIAEELINALTNIKDLHVVARTSAFSFRGKETDIRDIGRKLNVDTILEGSVRKAGNRLRITAQLINVVDGYHLWSEKYDRDMEDIFAIQDEISLAIADKLKPRLLGEEKAILVKHRTEDLDAYNLYLKGRYFWSKRTEQGLRKGIDCFKQAIEIDDGYALAYAGLADSYSLLCSYHILSPKESTSNARAAAMKAMELDDKLAESYESLAHVRILYDWRWLEAEREFRRAIELNSSYATAHQRYALLLTVMGRANEAIAEIKRAQELDPLSLIINTDVGLIHYIARKYDKAIEQYRTVLEMDPNFAVAHFTLGLVYEQQKYYREAIAEIRKAMALAGGSTVMMGALGHAYALSDRRDEATKVCKELQELSQRRYVSPYSIGAVYVGLGENDRAFEWLQKACDNHSVWLIHLHLRVDPRLDSLHSDPRFRALLKKIGLE